MGQVASAASGVVEEGREIGGGITIGGVRQDSHDGEGHPEVAGSLCQSRALHLDRTGVKGGAQPRNLLGLGDELVATDDGSSHDVMTARPLESPQRPQYLGGKIRIRLPECWLTGDDADGVAKGSVVSVVLTELVPDDDVANTQTRSHGTSDTSEDDARSAGLNHG